MLPVILIIGYTISVIDTKKTHDEWLMPWMWFANIFRTVSWLWSAIMVGRVIPKQKGTGGDSEFMEVTKAMMKPALEYAKEKMIEEGVVYPDAYLHRSFDCENFAQAQKHYVDLYISRSFGIKGKGIPSIIIGYDKDSGGGHAIMQMLIDGRNTYYECYPTSDKFFGYELSLKEKRSITIVVTG